MEIGSIEVLDDSLSQKVVDSVDELEKIWVRREPDPIDFFTIGACTYQEGVIDIKRYHQHREVVNPILIAHFSWLYDVVIEKLSKILGSIEVVDELGYPGFHIFGHKPGCVSHPACIEVFQSPSASLHFDHQYEEHDNYWEQFDKVDLENAFSFTLPVELPKYGGGLWLWNWREVPELDEVFNFNDSDGKVIAFKKYMDDFDPRYDKAFWKNKTSPALSEYDPIYDDKPIVLPYQVGRAFYHFGPVWHQIMPGYKLSDTDRRISLQGHGVKCDGVWRLYF